MTDLPKAELHCHLGGLLSPNLLRNTGSMNPNMDPDKLSSFYPIRDMDSWMRLGSFTQPLIHNNGYFLLKLLELYCDDLISRGADYIEVMLSHFLMAHDDIEKQCSLMDHYNKLREKLAGRLEMNFLYCLGRTADRGKMEARMERAVSLLQRGYGTGISLAADEFACDMKDYSDIFDELAELDIPVEIHAGEWGGPEKIWDALEYGHARRIGHGLAAIDDPLLMDHLVKEKIPLEICPTSNLILTKYRTMDDHPLKTFYEKGILLSINTDDPGHFDCTLDSELGLVQKELGFGQGEFERIYNMTRAAAFTPSPSPAPGNGQS